VTPDQQALIFRVACRPRSAESDRKTRKQLLVAFHAKDGRTLSREQLERAASARAADDVEASLVLVFLFGSDRSMLPVVKRLARERWHSRHEDIARLLEELGGDAVVADLEFLAWADPDFQDYEGSTSLAKKVVHSLERIGTPGARIALTRLRVHPEPDVRELVERVHARMPSAGGGQA
jgi:hypothetical protein